MCMYVYNKKLQVTFPAGNLINKERLYTQAPSNRRNKYRMEILLQILLLLLSNN